MGKEKIKTVPLAITDFSSTSCISYIYILHMKSFYEAIIDSLLSGAKYKNRETNGRVDHQERKCECDEHQRNGFNF